MPRVSEAQQVNVDSLLAAVGKQSGKDLMTTYRELSIYCLEDKIDFDRALVYARRSDSVALTIHSASGHADALCLQGAILSQIERGEEAAVVLKAGEEAARAASDTLLVEKCLRILARNYLKMGQHELATTYINKAIATDKRYGFHRELVFNLRTKARIRMGVFDFEEAKKIFDEAVYQLKVHPDPRTSMLVFESYATLLHDLNQFNDALHYIEQSVAIATALKDTVALANGYNIQATILKASGDYRKSHVFYQKALELNYSINNLPGMHRNLSNISDAYYHTGDLKNAFITLDSCIRLSAKHSGGHETEAVMRTNLGMVYTAIGDYEQAHRVLNDAHKIDFDSQRNDWEIYYRLAALFEKENKPDSALFMNLLGYQKDVRESSRQVLRLQRAKILSALHRMDSAAYYLNQVRLALARRHGPEGVVQVQDRIQLNYLLVLAFHEQQAGNVQDAALHYQKVAGKLDFWDNMETFKALYACYKAGNQPAAALTAFESYQQLRDSINNNLALYHQFESLTRFRTLEKEKENAQLQADKIASADRVRNTYTLAAAVAGVLLMLAGFYFYTSRKNQKANEVLTLNNEEKERQRLRAEDALRELKETEAQLILAEKTSTIGQMIAGIAHEVNNPLNFILSGVEALRERMADLKNVEDHSNKTPEVKAEVDETLADIDLLTDTIGKGASRTKIIIDGLLKISRDHGGVFSSTNLLENLDMALLFLKPVIAQKNITTSITHGEVPLLTLNAGEINQAFVNILLNAVQAISMKGTINIHIDTLEDNIRIVIRDSGQGIAPENLNKIFDPFFTTKEVGRGIGLGLSIARKIIANHGGTIHIDSEQNTGTTVTVMLPC
ncbi:ATP-binding protein [Chryseolinea lacunae]|uniref:histidine kinase n=1 Tax=Chryseolinea lacunae TaxID=2801331 RepID=A0ABS1KZN2_9BACT|nr:ATP-binding protein [Chryseolinea lacunae]MBL0744127.1 tetratricopeptide repeat protein [Chryseolinea lacunae]